jgi:hypothetical protein
MVPAWVWLVVLAVIVAPWVYEVVVQTIVQARLVRALPKEERASLPPHPSPHRLFLASEAFFVAFVRLVLEDDRPGDPETVARLKARLRTSLRRELKLGLAAILILGALSCLMLMAG